MSITPTTSKPTRVNGTVPKPKPEFEVGVSHYLPFVTPYKNAWEVQRDEEITVKQLVAMRKTDGQARALYRLITLPIRAALKGATFVPESNVDGGDEEAQFIEDLFTLPESAGGMTVPFGRFIAQMLLAIFDGFSAFELVYWTPKTGPLKGKWTLKKAAYRPSETLTFLIDDHGEFDGLRQRTMFEGKYIDQVIEADRCVYYAANEEEKPFYGQSFFQSAFYHWDKKFRLYVIAHLAAQRAAVGTRVGTLPKNPNRDEKLAFQKALSDVGVAQWMTMPDDYKVESLKESAGFDFLALINHHNSQMSKSVLAGFFDKEQGGGDSGKLVDFGTQSDALFLLMLQTIMGEIEEIINQKVIPRFIDWNFGSGKYPRFQFGNLSAEQKQAMFDLFKQLAVAGQTLTIRPEMIHEMEKQVSEELGLEIDWETVEATMAAEKAAEAAMQAPGASAQIDPALVPPGFNLGTPAPQPAVPAGPAGAPQPPAPGGAPVGLTMTDDEVELTRGRPNSGGPKFVRTAEGARVYGVPIGTPITRDMEQKTAGEGQKGKPYGGHVKKPSTKSGAGTPDGGKAGDTSDTGRQILGGGPGAQAQDLGGINTGHNPVEAPHRIYGNPNAPGAQLLEFADGTIAIQDAAGNLSPRQKFEISEFLKLGWQITQEPKPVGDR